MSTSAVRLLACGAVKATGASLLQPSLCCRSGLTLINGKQQFFGIRRNMASVARLLAPRSEVQSAGTGKRKGIPSVFKHPFYCSRSMASVAASGATVSNLPPGYIPEPPAAPVITESETGELIQQLNALGEPTLQSLGLGGWYPNGLVQLTLEALHVNLDIPWWTSIMLGTVMIRILMFPLVILAQKNTASTHNHTPIIQKMQEKFTKARQSGNPIEAARYGNELANYMKKHKVNPLKQMLVPMAQLPVFLSVFIGVRQMANLPVESMRNGGIFWFTDLTIPDPYYALPLLTMSTFLCTLEFGIDGVRAASMSTNMRYFMRAMPFVMLPFIVNFPSAMLCYWLTSNLFSFIQVMFLKIRPVKKFLDIPELVKHDESVVSSQKKPFFKSLKETYKNSKTAFDVEEMQRKEAVRFKEAGLGAIPKTYSYDPTKLEKKTSDGSKSEQ